MERRLEAQYTLTVFTCTARDTAREHGSWARVLFWTLVFTRRAGNPCSPRRSARRK